MDKTPPHHLYIHVPFCANKCPYCAFYSAAVAPDWDAYADGIIKSVARQPRCRVPTIFFGGGTPSLMPTDILAKILGAIGKHFLVADGAEITIECNPRSANLADYKALGITRISIGAQSFDDGHLRFLGRIHTAKQARLALDAALDAGFETSADFIYALPGQSVDDVARLCEEIKKIGLRHASLYEITPEANPKFSPSDSAADMWLEIGRQLRRYEISNYARPGHECRHNSGVWDGEPYIGLGAGAAGRLFDGENWFEQFSGAIKPMTARDRAIEKVITGLRTARGVKLAPDVLEVLKTPPSGERLALGESDMLILDSKLVDMVK
ncbi:MAG: coproporphyrinogen III oxidase family protein [Rickettsiales bacterium]|jgi:oxygen-independent coproporphyrinogen-3 oxidase|nr:coproporphyrinogen III oxidase family protein [Rickettsiales bacterium]